MGNTLNRKVPSSVLRDLVTLFLNIWFIILLKAADSVICCLLIVYALH